jgi:hypothetical protein
MFFSFIIRGVNLPRRPNLICLGLFIAACLALLSCGRKISPQETKQSWLDWNLKTTVGAYLEIGNTDPKWDEAATNALIEFARSRSESLDQDEDWAAIIRTNCDAAVQSDCDDPMIRYLYIRFCMSQTNSPQVFADAFHKMADDMEQSSYPPIRKFYAAARTLNQVFYAYHTNVDRQLVGELGDDMAANLMTVLSDKTTPPEEAYQACSEALYEFSGSKSRYEDCYNKIEQPLFKNWPRESASWLLKGEAYIQMAWFARGNGYANTVTADAQKLFGEHLDEADKALNQAWKLNPKDYRIPLQMMEVELGQGKGRDTMELWFDRAMELDPDDYEACSSKLNYLEPKWYGSTDDMLEFGRECVQNTNWGGRVPLILVDAHYNICNGYIDQSQRTNYWSQPDVWADVKSAYERFFELNPDAISYYYNYAWYAYHAEDWDKLNELIPKLGPVNYSYFGGEDEFNKMVQLAKDHAGRPAAAPQ